MPDDDFTRGDALRIAHNCTVDVVGHDHALDPSSKLSGYGIISTQQESLLRHDVLTNNSIGVPSYNRTLDPNALKDLSKDWTIGTLRDVIFENSESASAPPASVLAMAAPGGVSGRGDTATPGRTLGVAALAGAAGMLVGFFIGRRR